MNALQNLFEDAQESDWQGSDFTIGYTKDSAYPIDVRMDGTVWTELGEGDFADAFDAFCAPLQDFTLIFSKERVVFYTAQSLSVYPLHDLHLMEIEEYAGVLLAIEPYQRVLADLPGRLWGDAGLSAHEKIALQVRQARFQHKTGSTLEEALDALIETAHDRFDIVHGEGCWGLIEQQDAPVLLAIGPRL